MANSTRAANELMEKIEKSSITETALARSGEEPPIAESSNVVSMKVVSVVAEHHDITIAALAAMLFPGGGQFYNSQAGKGLSLLSLTVLGLILLLINLQTLSVLLLLLGAIFLLWLIGIIDAGLIAGRLIRHEWVRPWQWF